MVETTLEPINKDEEILNGLVVTNTQKDLLPAIKKEPQFKDTLLSLLNIPVEKDKLCEVMGDTVPETILPEEPTMADYLAGAMIMKASLGDTKAYEVIRDTMGQKPVERVEQDTVVKIEMPNEIREYGD